MLFDWRRSAASALLVVLTGCPSVNPDKGLPLAPVAQVFDYNDFVCDAMPVLVRHCSYLGCHGDERRGFRVYSPGKLRAGDVTTRAQRDATLTSAELQLNFESASGILLGAQPANGDPIDVGNALLLQKPLAARFGGSEHHGVAVFPVYPSQTLADDAEWNALVAWASGKKQPSPPTQSCLDLFSSLGAMPK